MKRYVHLYRFVILFCAMFLVQNVVAQVNGDQYDLQKASVDFSRVSGSTFGNGGSSAVDGNEGTYWKSNSTYNDSYIILDVGQNYPNITKFEIYVAQEDRRGETLTISCSDDPSGTWNTVMTIPEFYNTDRHKVAISLSGPYVKLDFSKRSGSSNYRQVNVNEVYFYERNAQYEDKSIRHKPAKWYDLRKQLQINAADNFDEADEAKMNMGYDGKTQIQAAHTLIDTIYVHKGTSVTLTLPDYLGGAANNKTYQRWYNYMTEETFATGNTGNNIVDLLTPAEKGQDQPTNGTGYRFKNGYVGQPLSANCLYKMNFYVPANGDNWYLVACDVSGYTDYTESFDLDDSKNSKFANGYWEPTLSHRFIYFIRAIDDPSSPANKALAKGNPIEEKTITMPATRLPDYTREMVALSMDARSYITPGGSNNEAEGELDVSISADDNSAGIKLVTESLVGEERVISFDYPNTNGDNTQSVNTTSGGDPTATIEVKRGSTVVARFHLVFKEEDRLLTQTQVSQENAKADSKYRYRMPDYLKENYELLTELNFDFDDAVAERYGQTQCYPFPIGWNSSTYGFYDGSANVKDFNVPSTQSPEWGYYGLLNSYVECNDKSNSPWAWTYYQYTVPDDKDPIRYNSKGNPSTYHLYADVSDRPGVIARLPFDKKLCPGTELFVTAWVKCARGSEDANNAAALFTIMGVKSRDVGNSASTKDYIPIYRYQTGQIPATYRNDGGLNVPGFEAGTGLYNDGNRYGGYGGNNDWMQVYFSFINTDDGNFDSYALQVDNNSASTNGGDIYIDDIRVYMVQPNATVTQLEATCTQERTLMSAELNWEQLLSRLGYEDGGTGEDAIDFCFIDEAKYNAYLAEHADDYEGAIEASVAEVGKNDGAADSYNGKYHTLYFKLPFEQNTSYNATSTAHNLAINNSQNGRYYFYGKTDEADVRTLAVDFYSALTPNRPYIMLINTHNPNDAELTAEDFAATINDVCAIKTTFYVTTQTLLRVNGEVVDPSTDFCAGQIFNFSANMRVPTDVNDDGTNIYTEIKDGVYYDWFFGSEDEYVAPNSTYDYVSLMDALVVFRDIYPDNTDLTGVTVGEQTTVDGQTLTFTQSHYDIIKAYMEADGTEGGIHNRLILHRENLDITLLNSGLQLVIQPIPTIKAPGGSGISNENWAKVCWTYVPLTLEASGNAPQLHAGFNSTLYPADDFNPALRIGLSQIEEATTAAKPITIDLRGAAVVSPGADHIGMITSVSPEMFSKIYLVDTDDPAYKNDKFFPQDFSEYSLPIGTITSLYAEPYDMGSTFINQMKVYFDTETTQDNGFKFQPKEGYTYTFAVHFEEKSNSGESSNACFGSFVVPMKVVPENVVWKGNASGTSNWNKDENWARADKKDDLKKTDEDAYLTNEANTTSQGFVPMLFTNVIMPSGSKAELYMAGYGQIDGGKYGWDSKRPTYMELPTENIQYDLMAYEKDGALTTQRYRVNICRDIHFEPGAQMLHAEELLYNKAWTDVEVEPGKWTLVSTPLKDVVAGDWYVPTTGQQATEYFKDITFADGVYNRLNPAIYQRSWSDGATIVEQVGGTNNNPMVSFTTEWSSVYNDASVPYSAGAGFSLKAIASGQTTPLLFRFPKADASYSYSNDVSTATASLSRGDAGKLLISDMVDRSDPYTYEDPTNVTVALKPSPAKDGARYLMVGNPFMTSLDVRKFVEANEDVLAQKYWYVKVDETTGESTQADALGDDGNWTATIAYQAAPYSVFYVQAADLTAAEVSVQFTSDMQVPFTQTSGTTSASLARALQIEAADSHGSSQALLSYSAQADNACASEDAVLLSNLSGNATAAPQVYTVAGNTAVSVNWLKDAQQIPLGVFAATDDDDVTLTFTGLGALRSPRLYDAELNTETPLSEGYQLTVKGSSHGRYFLRSLGSALTGLTPTTTDPELTVYSVRAGELIVSSNVTLQSVQVFTADGRRLSPLVQSQTDCVWRLSGVDKGVVMVEAKTNGGHAVRKVMVK